jgi:ubiquinone/menaquinone biosynthesis C-methylase UbiE
LSSTSDIPLSRFYDTVADGYDRTWGTLFTLRAKDLVVTLRLRSGERVPDVGTGTGVAMLPAAKAVGSAGAVVGLDGSVEMLRIAQAKGGSPLAVAAVPEVPIADDSSDAALSNFVISHLPEYGRGLSAMVRVLRRGGRLGVTAWGAGVSSFSQLWREVAESFVSEQVLHEANLQGPPWEQWFSEPAHLQQVLGESGLVEIQLRSAVHGADMRVADYVGDKGRSPKGRAMRQALTGAQWERFRTGVAEEFHLRFGESMTYTAVAHLAVGTKP